MLPKQAISHAQLLKEGFSKKRIEAMSAAVRLFPTPFKGIYYVPMPEERKGWFIEKPLNALTSALGLFLKGRFYYSCATAEESLGLKWAPSGEVHVVNEKRSGKVDIEERVKRNERKKTYRAGKMARLLSFYGRTIIFHKTKDVSKAKTRQTPYGRFALRSQIKKDRERFRKGARELLRQ